MAGDVVLGLRLTADGKGFRGEVRLAAADVDKFGKATGRAGKQADAAAAGTDRFGDAVQRAHRKVARYAAGLLGLHTAQRAVRELSAAADAYTEISNRIGLVTGSEAELTDVRERLFDVSQRTRSDFRANVDLYGRLALASQTLGLEQSKLIRLTEVLNKQVAVGGSTSQEAAQGLRQLAQGIASNRLSGDELRSVLEQLLGVQVGLLSGFRRLREQGKTSLDVTAGNIRKLAEEGKLTARLTVDALLASADQADEAFAKLNVRISDSLVVLGNSLNVLIGQLDASYGASSALAAEIVEAARAVESGEFGRIAEEFGLLDDALAVVAGSLAGRLLTALNRTRRAAVGSAQAWAGLLLALNGTPPAVTRANLALTTLRSGLRSTLALLGGWPGLALSAAYIGYEWSRSVSAQAAAFRDLGDEMDDVVAAIPNLTRAQRHQARDGAREEIDRLEARLAGAESRLDRVSDPQPRFRRGLERNIVNATVAVEEYSRQLDLARAKLRALADETPIINPYALPNSPAEFAPLAGARVSPLFSRAAPSTLPNSPAVAPTNDGARLVAQLRRELELRGELTREQRLDLDIRAGRVKLNDAEESQVRRLARANDERDRAEAKAAKDRADARRDERDAAAARDRAARDLAEWRVANDRAGLDAFERQRAAARDRADAIVAGLRDEEVDLMTEAYAARDAEIARVDAAEAKERRGRLDEARRESLRNSRLAADGARRAFGDFASYAGDAAANIEEAIHGTFRGLEDSLTDFVATGELSIGRLVDSIIADFARLAIRQAILGPLANAFLGALGGNNAADNAINNLAAGNFHAGGVAGQLGGMARNVPPAVFAGAPRLHRGGLAGDEVPAILRRGEGVFTPEQMAALGAGTRSVEVSITNESGEPLRAREATSREDGSRLVIGIVLEDLATRGPLARGIEGQYGLRPATR